jgi:hypothetical protein
VAGCCEHGNDHNEVFSGYQPADNPRKLHYGHSPGKHQIVYGNEPSVPIKGGEFPDNLSDC